MRNVLASQFMNPTDTNLLALSSNTGSGFLWSCSLRFSDSLVGFRGSGGSLLLGLGSLRLFLGSPEICEEQCH